MILFILSFDYDDSLTYVSFTVTKGKENSFMVMCIQ